MKRIGLVHTNLGIGGSTYHLMELVQRGAALGFEFKLYCVLSSGPLSNDFRASGVAPVVVGNKIEPPYRTFGWIDPILIFRLARRFVQDGVDLVHVHLWPSSIIGRMAAVVARIPVIETVHNVDVWKGTQANFIDNVLDRATRQHICVSEAVAAFVRATRPNARRVSVIHNGVGHSQIGGRELRAELGFEESDVIAGYAGRLEPVKRVDRLVRAASELPPESNVKVLIVGEGSERRRIERLSTDFGGEQRITFRPFQRSVWSALSAMDIFVQPSEREGLCLTVMEAMSAGIPVIASGADALRELVGDAGIVLRSIDDELASELTRLAGDPALRADLGARGQRRISSNFSAERFRTATYTQYSEVLSDLAANRT